jgi:Fur family ferric uptake transcriptional regulator
MSHKTVDYAGMIRAKGYRVTPQRELVLDSVCECGPHCSFEEVYERVQKRSSTVAQSTVYRALDFLQEVGLITGSYVDDTQVYEIAVGHPRHHHLLCTECGRNVEISGEAAADFLASIKALTGFQVEEQHLILRGVCKDCRQKAGD